MGGGGGQATGVVIRVCLGSKVLKGLRAELSQKMVLPNLNSFRSRKGV